MRAVGGTTTVRGSDTIGRIEANGVSRHGVTAPDMGLMLAVGGSWVGLAPVIHIERVVLIRDIFIGCKL
jgi:hypothetical protein